MDFAGGLGQSVVSGTLVSGDEDSFVLTLREAFVHLLVGIRDPRRQEFLLNSF